MATREPRQPNTVRLGHLIRRALGRHQHALSDGLLVLAVSGGADSMAMLLAAAQVRRSLKRALVVAHFSHGIRRTAERGEARLVRRTVSELGLAFAHEQAHLSGDEASAREARYAFLAKVAVEHGAAAVLTAHTKDDQAETLLLRLARGTGTRGAGAIRELAERDSDGRRIMLLRPLLEATRVDTEAVCREWGVTPASDGTNRSLRYARNRIRRHVIPDLQAINLDVRAALAGFAGDAQDDEDALQEAALAAIGDEQVVGEGWVEWRTSALADMPRALAVRLLQTAWTRLRGEGDALSRRQIESIARVLGRGTGSVDLRDGYTFAVEQDRTAMRRAGEDAAPEAVVLPVPGQVRFGRWRITASIVSGRDSPVGPWTAMVDSDALSENVLVRGRRRGDRFQPLGMAREVRLQDMLVNAKVPRSERDGRPLVVSARGIAWVGGVRIAEWAKVTEDTTRVVRIEVARG